MPIERLTSRNIYANPWLSLREDRIRHPDGHEGIYSVVDKADFALVVPWDGERLWLVEQERYPVRARFWEFPQGTAEDGAAPSPAELARAELAEETGLRTRELTHVGHLFIAYGMSSQGFDVFWATELERGPQRLGDGEQGLRVGAFTVAELEAMLLDGRIADAASVAAWGLLGLRGLRPGQ